MSFLEKLGFKPKEQKEREQLERDIEKTKRTASGYNTA